MADLIYLAFAVHLVSMMLRMRKCTEWTLTDWFTETLTQTAVVWLFGAAND